MINPGDNDIYQQFNIERKNNGATREVFAQRWSDLKSSALILMVQKLYHTNRSMLGKLMEAVVAFLSF